MSHHILQQFDEQWLAEIARGDAPAKSQSFFTPTVGESEKTSPYSLASPMVRHWLFSIAALIIAAFAFLLAHGAERRAYELEQRLAAYERAASNR